MTTEFGVSRGKVFPAAKASSLLNPLRRLVQPASRIAGRLGVAPESRVLEVGCGPGYFTPALVAAVPAGQVVLFDLQSEMLHLAGARVGADATALQGDATRLPLRSATFDAVVVVLMLGEVPDRDGCLAEIRRVLRPGGIVLFAESRRDGDFIRFDDLHTLLVGHGFEFVDRRGPGWEYTARFRTR